MAEHISAFANFSGGGIFAFGVNNDGSLSSITKSEADNIIQKMGNIAKNNLSSSIEIDHTIVKYNGNTLLFIHIPESTEKPIHLRGSDIYESFCRSAGQTVKMDRNSVETLIARSKNINFEEVDATEYLTIENALSMLDYGLFFKLLDKNSPNNPNIIIQTLEEYQLVKFNEKGVIITNLGAILFAKDITTFRNLRFKSVTVNQYRGTNNREIETTQTGKMGYAVGFEGLIDYIMNRLPKNEVIVGVRKDNYIIPKVSIREFVANALIHQDFYITGMPITISIFTNRVEITNPGAPLNDINRLIDLPPRSRNEILAQLMYQFKMCERRGSGIDRAIEAIELMKLPPVQFARSESHTSVTIYFPKKYSNMTKTERILACYQHACMLFEDKKSIDNQALRERLGVDKQNSSFATKILSDTLDAGYIKPADSENVSRKYSKYIPNYA